MHPLHFILQVLDVAALTWHHGVDLVRHVCQVLVVTQLQCYSAIAVRLFAINCCVVAYSL
jgi:hypothetical protein